MALIVRACWWGMNEQMKSTCFQVEKKQIGYLRFILEGYDGLGFIRTLDAAGGSIEIAWPVSGDADMQALLAALGTEVPMRVVPRPENYESI